MATRKSQSPALAFVQHVWDHAPSSSWERFNHALHTALRTAITSGMKFADGDFAHMAGEMRLGRWSGENLEWAYSLACGSDRNTENPSAVKALESSLRREPFIWAERTKTPARLYVGDQFTWKGHRVTVTSFNDNAKSLTACTYERDSASRDGFKVGSLDYVDGYRTIEALSQYEDGSMAVRFGPKVEDDTRKVAKRFTITLADLKSARAEFDRRRRDIEQAIAEANTIPELELVRLRASEAGAASYRHFDIEIINEALAERQKFIEEEPRRRLADAEEAERRERAREAEVRYAELAKANMERWLAGEDVNGFLARSEIRIRLKGDYIEVSNGNKVSIDAARKALKFVKRHRASGWHANGRTYDVDIFPLRSVSGTGVQIGCTLIPWPEVERCEQLLAK